MILFLDFDGVLHPLLPRADFSEQENRLFANLPRLEAIMRDYPALQIVISSSWRKGTTLEQLTEPFSPDIRERVIGMIPLLELVDGAWVGHRHREILAWLADNRVASTPWIALDDVVENFFPNAPLIFCDDRFAEREEAALRQWLEVNLRNQDKERP